jgi:hypothetical protein
MGTDVGTDVGTGKNHETGRNHCTDMAQVEGMGTDTWYRDQSRHGHESMSMNMGMGMGMYMGMRA